MGEAGGFHCRIELNRVEVLLRHTQHWEMNCAIEDSDPNSPLTKSEKEMEKK